MRAKRYVYRREAIAYEGGAGVVKFEVDGQQIECFGRYYTRLNARQVRKLAAWLESAAGIIERRRRGG